MKNSKLYFILSMVTNVLFVASALVWFYEPFGITTWNASGFAYGFLGLIFFFAPFVLLPFTVLLLLWGLWLVFKSKIRNKFVVIGLIACLASLSITAVLVQKANERTKCPFEKGEPGWPCIITNPL